MSIQIPEEQIKAWREEFQKWWFLDHNDTSEINRAYAWAAWLSAKTSSYEREQKIITALKCCENDYWFMTNLLEKYSTNRDEAVKNCIERMKFRKPIFEVVK